MTEVKDFVVETMTPLLGGESASLQVHLAKEYDVQKWLKPGITRLVERSAPIDDGDVKFIGVTEALKVCRLREDRIRGGSMCGNCGYRQVISHQASSQSTADYWGR